MTLFVQCNILWLQIPIYYLVFVQMLDSQYQFTHILSGVSFAHFLLESHLLAQIASLAVFHDQVKSVRVLESVFKINDKRMFTDDTQNVLFSEGISS